MTDRIDTVVKIGSLALIQKDFLDIDFNVISRLCCDLRPGMVLISSGAVEAGRLDYISKTGKELEGNIDEIKADYAAQGQAQLMAIYRLFFPAYLGLRQLLVEHTHINDPEKRMHILNFLNRAARQNSIPIVNYNDCVSDEENRKLELAETRRRAGGQVYECIDNDETAAVIANLTKARMLVILTVTEGIYRDPDDPATLVREVSAATPEELEAEVRKLQENCVGASRPLANGARAKLEYALRTARNGTTVVIGSSQYRLADLIAGTVPCTRIALKK